VRRPDFVLQLNLLNGGFLKVKACAEVKFPHLNFIVQHTHTPVANISVLQTNYIPNSPNLCTHFVRIKPHASTVRQCEMKEGLGETFFARY
jgi:hypothetical protein